MAISAAPSGTMAQGSMTDTAGNTTFSASRTAQAPTPVTTTRRPFTRAGIALIDSSGA